MTLNKFRIGLRLGMAFAFVTTLTLLTALYAMTQLEAGNARLRSIVSVNNAKLEHANDMSRSVQIEQRVLRSMVLLSNPSEIAGEAWKIDEARAVYDEAWAKMIGTPGKQEAVAIRAAIDSGRKATQPLFDKIRALALSNQDEEAVRILMKESLPIAGAWRKAIDDNLKHLKAENQALYESAQESHARSIWVMSAATALAIAVSALLAWMITRSIVRPLAKAVAVTGSLADGNLDTAITVEGRDELAALSSALSTMRNNLREIVLSVRANSESVATASAQIAQGNHDLSGRTEQQASALEETAATMEELGATVRKNADSAKQANQLAQGASTVAAQGGDVVGKVVITMQDINSSSRQIGDIISVIDGIAFQTNILALNAAVEAARAGEQGRGFAVVASEVRNLAKRSADAAKEIKVLITRSVEQVEQGTALVDQAGQTMSEIVGSIKRVTDIVAEISAASAEQSSGVQQVGEAVSQMDQATQQNAALVEESAAASASLQGQAQQLVNAVAVFKLA